MKDRLTKREEDEEGKEEEEEPIALDGYLVNKIAKS
jgi:hypothetical protein